MATNNAVNEPTAASGKVLQGQGVGTTSAFSTATYPATATTTGQILRADGTNWVGTTATYPNTAGTSGNVLTSDGTNWSSTALSNATLTILRTQLTSAQIKLLVTPLQLVATPGSGKVLALVDAWAIFNYGGSNVFVAGASQTLSISWGSGGALNAVTTLCANSFIVQAGNGGARFAADTFGLKGLSALANLGFFIYNTTATNISGNAAGDNTIDIVLLYYTITV